VASSPGRLTYRTVADRGRAPINTLIEQMKKQIKVRFAMTLQKKFVAIQIKLVQRFAFVTHKTMSTTGLVSGISRREKDATAGLVHFTFISMQIMISAIQTGHSGCNGI
jgi:hypothetical protein